MELAFFHDRNSENTCLYATVPLVARTETKVRSGALNNAFISLISPNPRGPPRNMRPCLNSITSTLLAMMESITFLVWIPKTVPFP